MTTMQKMIKYVAIAFAIFLIVSIFGGIVSVISGFAVASGDKDVVGEMKTYAVTKTVAGNFPPPICLRAMGAL